MAVAETPSDWTDAGLDSAVFSDPRPVLAVLAAIREREAIARPSSEFDVERSRVAGIEALYGADVSWTVREVPGHTLARLVARRIRDLCDRFVDMDYDYAARDWTEFPIMLSERFARGEHPMAWCPGPDDPETDEAVGAWRTFLADCRWWLDRMHVVEVARADYRFGKKIEIGSGSACYSETETRQADGTSQTVVGANVRIADFAGGGTETAGSFQPDAGYRLGAFLSVGVEQFAVCQWDSTNQSYYLHEKTCSESVDGLSFANLRVRNRYPTEASLVLVACGGKKGGGSRFSAELCKRSDYLVGFEYQENDPDPRYPTVVEASAVSRAAYLPESLSGGVAVYDETAQDLSSGTRTETGWSHDFSENLVKAQTDAGALDTTYHAYGSGPFDSRPPEAREEREWGPVPTPGLMGLANLGPNVLATIAAGARTDDLLAWADGFDGALAEDWWKPDALHEYENKNERRHGSATFGIVVVPCLDFEAAFRFKAEPQEEE